MNLNSQYTKLKIYCFFLPACSLKMYRQLDIYWDLWMWASTGSLLESLFFSLGNTPADKYVCEYWGSGTGMLCVVF